MTALLRLDLIKSEQDEHRFNQTDGGRSLWTPYTKFGPTKI
jgi:hypothetical protein